MTDPKPTYPADVPNRTIEAFNVVGRAVYGPQWDDLQAARQERIAAAARAEVRQAHRDRITQACVTLIVIGCLLGTLAILTAGAVWAWRAL